MNIPAATKPALWGAIAGAAALAFIGFNWAGWVTANSAETFAKERASKAVIAALAPICHDNFRRGSDVAAQTVELKKINSWDQAGFIEKGGWTKMPGVAAGNRDVARACAELIIAAKA